MITYAEFRLSPKYSHEYVITIGTDRYRILQWLGGHWSPSVPIGINDHQCWSLMGKVRAHEIKLSYETLRYKRRLCSLATQTYTNI